MTAYLFDLFHTLVHFKIAGPLQRDLLGVSAEEWENQIDHPAIYEPRALGRVTDPMEIVRLIARHFGKALSPEEERELLRLRVERFRATLTNVRPEILQTLRELRRRGHPLCLVSNADCIDVMYWDECPLAPLFDAAVFSYQVRMMKPDPEIYRLAARRVGCTPGECVFVGDGGSKELVGARRVGMRTMQARHLVQREAEGADAVIGRFEELLAI
jgi:putative hydrolase of the HAD superfamily